MNQEEMEDEPNEARIAWNRKDSAGETTEDAETCQIG